MALLIVISTSGVVISKHVCNGEVKNIAVFHKAESCEHIRKSTSMQCPIHQGMILQVTEDHNNCCSDTIELVKDDHPQIEAKSFEIPDFQWIIISLILYPEINSTLSNESKLNDCYLHLPPLINQEIPILLHSFLL